MNRNKYAMIVQIGRNVTDIMALPCVIQAQKTRSRDGKKHIIMYLINDGKYNTAALEGDYICKDYEGNWHVEYNRQ